MNYNSHSLEEILFSRLLKLVNTIYMLEIKIDCFRIFKCSVMQKQYRKCTELEGLWRLFSLIKVECDGYLADHILIFGGWRQLAGSFSIAKCSCSLTVTDFTYEVLRFKGLPQLHRYF